MTKTKWVRAIGFSLFLTAIVIFVSCMMISVHANLGITIATVLMIELGGQALFLTSNRDNTK
jgi:hypothetical protein